MPPPNQNQRTYPMPSTYGARRREPIPSERLPASNSAATSLHTTQRAGPKGEWETIDSCITFTVRGTMNAIRWPGHAGATATAKQDLAGVSAKVAEVAGERVPWRRLRRGAIAAAIRAEFF